MLAKNNVSISHWGRLAPDLQPKNFSLHAVLDFVEGELPRWRNHEDRTTKSAEANLTSDLAAYLNQVARHSRGLDILQFRTEVPDEKCGGRAIDLAPGTCEVVWVNGRRYTYSDILMPIECKRFPIPKRTGRDQREYVVSSSTTTGGIQRFKAGYHGSDHVIGGMIGYIQSDSASEWFERVSNWIEDLSASGEPGWSSDDLLHSVREESGVYRYRSQHKREKSLPNIELQHLWINMVTPLGEE
jgi:hypothetical protein